MSKFPAIPQPEDWASARLVHRPDDLLFNPPCVQNEWGYAQCANSITAFQSVQFPPFLSNCATDAPWTLSFMPTCELYLDGRIFGAWPAPEGDVAFQWFPHQVVRETTVNGLELRSELFLPPESQTAAQRITLSNPGDAPRTGWLAFSLHSALAKANFDINGTPRFLGAATDEAKFDETVGDVPNLPEPLCEADNQVEAVDGYGALLFSARHSPAFAVQGFGEPTDSLPEQRQARFNYHLPPGESRSFRFVMVLGEQREAVIEGFKTTCANFDRLQAETREAWARRLEHVFQPGNPEFSGALPAVEIDDPDLWRLHHNGLATLLFHRTCNPNSVLGPTYLAVRAQQRPARVYLWDAALVAPVLARLDPEGLKRILEGWMRAHIDRHMDIDFITGKSLENHYATNHMYLVEASANYLEHTGNWDWLDQTVGAKAVFEHLLDNALAWKKVADPETGLADYTESDLLEVVSSYKGQVAALQAGSVGAMRTVAGMAAKRGAPELAESLREQATHLAEATIRHLYVEGEGVWRCLHRDGKRPVVRHAFDAICALEWLREDLSEQQRSEIIAFFWRELAADGWMYALSPADTDAYWNRRADHCWCGSYPGWPALFARLLRQLDPGERTEIWIRSLAKSANQGPFGQAQLVPGAYPAENGGARKAPLVMPLLAEWGALSGGAFARLALS